MTISRSRQFQRSSTKRVLLLGPFVMYSSFWKSASVLNPSCHPDVLFPIKM
jgi:hypothetical protein